MARKKAGRQVKKDTRKQISIVESDEEDSSNNNRHVQRQDDDEVSSETRFLIHTCRTFAEETTPSPRQLIVK